MSDLSPATTKNLVDMLSGGRSYSGGNGPRDREPNVKLWNAAGLLKSGSNSVSQKGLVKALARTAKGTAEVTVKITGKQSNAGHVAANFLYIGRTDKEDEKEVELETDDENRTITSIDEAYKEAALWEKMEKKGDDRRTGAVSRSMILSAPEGSDPEKVHEAARQFAKEELGNSRYVMALHTDQKHPHVHITYAIRDKDGRRSYPNRDTLHQYRQTFARELRAQGIEANATSRKSRGVVAERVRADSRQARDQGKPLDRDTGATPPKGRTAYLTALRNQRDTAIDTYRTAIAELEKSADPANRDVAQSLSTFVAKLEKERAEDPTYKKQQADQREDREQAERKTAALVREKPDHALSMITAEKSVFTKHDVSRTILQHSPDAETFLASYRAAMASNDLVHLQGERTRTDPQGREITEPARYSTREMTDIETGMADAAEQMAAQSTHGVAQKHIDAAVEQQNAAIQASVAIDMAVKVQRGVVDSETRDSAVAKARLSGEQVQAVQHVTGPERIALVQGYAGAGKSTMLSAAREAWEAEGYTVQGAALAGKAAEGLQHSSGIESYTLAALTRSWEKGEAQLGRNDVLVIDEAGMVGSRQMGAVMREAYDSGAKIVMVGDQGQLQAIDAGAPFHALVKQVGATKLEEIRRQRADWQRDASQDFANEKTIAGLQAYDKKGAVQITDTVPQARAGIVRDYMADREAKPDSTRLALAHRREDVKALNDGIRAQLQERGELAKGEGRAHGAEPDGNRANDRAGAAIAAPAGEIVYQTNAGERSFAAGDRIIFLENNRELGVKNGMLGTVGEVRRDGMTVQLDKNEAGKQRGVSIDTDRYTAIDHGYATTLHKTQGASVDRSFVLATKSMDRHLTYVAMTRHRDSVKLFGSQDQFADRRVGKLIEHGAAPYKNEQGNSPSYFVTVENSSGKQTTIWGVGLNAAMQSAAPAKGERIALEMTGKEAVTLPSGAEGQRNIWEIRSPADTTKQIMEKSLSKSRQKETVLDYGRSFAQQRSVKLQPAQIDSKTRDAPGTIVIQAAPAKSGEAAPAVAVKNATVRIGGEKVQLAEFDKRTQAYLQKAAKAEAKQAKQSDRSDKLRAPEFVTLGGEKMDISRESKSEKRFMRELDIKRERRENPKLYERAGVGKGDLKPNEVRIGGEKMNLVKMDRDTAKEIVSIAAERGKRSEAKQAAQIQPPAAAKSPEQATASNKAAPVKNAQPTRSGALEKALAESREMTKQLNKDVKQRVRDKSRDRSR